MIIISAINPFRLRLHFTHTRVLSADTRARYTVRFT